MRFQIRNIHRNRTFILRFDTFILAKQLLGKIFFYLVFSVELKNRKG